MGTNFYLRRVKPREVYDECRMFKLGIPFGYEAGGKYRAERAHEVAEMLNEKEGL